MANRIAEITLPDGRVAEIEGDEAKIMEFVKSLPDVKQANSPSSSRDLGFGNVQAKMNQPLPNRPNPFMAGAESVKSLRPRDFIPGNIEGMGKQGIAALQVMGAPYLAAESIVANRSLRAQKNPSTLLNPADAIRDFYAGATGQQRTIGDVNYRAGLNRPTADVTGAAQSLVVQAPQLVEGGINLARKGVEYAGRQAGSVLKPIARSFPEAVNILKSGKNMSQQNVGAFREKIVSSVNSKMSQAGEQFGSVIDDLSTKSQTPVDLNQYAQEISESIKDNPKIASIVRKVPGLSNLLESQSKTMSLSESQNLFKMIGSKLKTTGGKIDFETRQALTTLKNELRNAQIDSLSDDVLKAEFKVARQTWSKVKNDYDVIKRQFNVTNFENTVKTMFGDRNLLKEAMNRLSPQDLIEMSMASKAIKIGGYAKKAAITVLGGGLIGGAAKLGSSLID